MADPRDDATQAGHVGRPAAVDGDPWIGRVVAGRFRVDAFLAAGGIGRVYRAWQEDLERTVALKVLHPHLSHEESQKRRFHLEARVASRLRHPSAVVIHDHGEWEGHLFLVMELLEGRTLTHVLEDEFPLPPGRIARLLAPACEVLHEAHEAGILHRDVKPSNLFVTRDPDGTERIKVMDFGLLRDLRRAPEDAGLTPADLVAGTPAYMSPEQARGGHLDRRSDVYALGVVLYEVLCNRLPFSGTTDMDAMVQHLYNLPEPPSARCPEVAVPPALEALALRALSKSPAARPPTALAFRDDLLQAAASDEAGPAPPTPREDRAARPRARVARADDAGIQPLEDPTRLGEGVRSEGVVLVVEPPGVFDGSLTALLRARGFAADVVRTLDEALDLCHEARPVAWVVDVRPDPAALLEALGTLASRPVLAGVPRVVVGPEDSLEPMARALEAGIRDYVPESSVEALLPRVLDGILRARLRGARGGGAR